MKENIGLIVVLVFVCGMLFLAYRTNTTMNSFMNYGTETIDNVLGESLSNLDNLGDN